MSYLDDIHDISVPTVPKGRTGGIDPMTDARARVHALAHGVKWECRRVHAWVDLSECLRRRAAQDGYNPCRECATIAKYTSQEDTMRKTPKPTIAPIQETAQAQEKTPIAPATDPLAGLMKYEPLSRPVSPVHDVSSVHLSTSTFSFSRKAVNDFRMHEYETAAMFFDGEPGNVSRIVVQLGGESLRLTRSSKESMTRNLSAHGIVRHLNLHGLINQRYSVREIKPGFLEIDFSKKICAKATAGGAA